MKVAVNDELLLRYRADSQMRAPSRFDILSLPRWEEEARKDSARSLTLALSVL